MSDADGREISYVGDDMGEGIKNFLEEDPRSKLAKEFTNYQARLQEEELKNTLEKSKQDREVLDEILERVKKLEFLIKQIFGDQVLIKGRWLPIDMKDNHK